MQSTQAVLRLAGGAASALLVLSACFYFCIDLLPQVAKGSLLRAMHFSAECTLLGGGGVCGVLAEIRPHPAVSENFPYLTRLSGRSIFYAFFGMFVIGRRESRSPGGPASILWWAWCAFQWPWPGPSSRIASARCRRSSQSPSPAPARAAWAAPSPAPPSTVPSRAELPAAPEAPAEPRPGRCRAPGAEWSRWPPDEARGAALRGAQEELLRSDPHELAPFRARIADRAPGAED
ncbi:unnamed protein product [Effrenium voratum]|nr:unnamed protein product [Effrenium voratum]